MAASVTLEFLGGEELTVPLLDEDLVRDLLKRAKTAKPPPAMASLQIASGEVLFKPSESAAPLAGKTVQALYSPTLSYLVPRDGSVALVDECHEEWMEDIAAKMQVPEESWVPAPDADGGSAGRVRNLAKLAEGVTLTTTRAFQPENEMLLNLLRLGSKVGEPLYVPEQKHAFRGGGDGSPKLILDFGRVVTLQRVGAICSGTDKFKDWLEVWSKSEDGDDGDDSWESWGIGVAGERPGFFSVDRHPTQVRVLRINASSGRIPGGRVRHLFAYGFDEIQSSSDATVLASI
eukprot:gnl/TRDRNA2_/TRDRNA2_188077_c0_seq1.p1 gnl/TRDRNA2_/TRDRNA2_188077_c0~~gnl/TRDRNA2_/TRDRNA2_188077_c0_seq1.p1  ORF type:complete len:290 (+),score=56.31 gnl/TRDRNA2_/TRDRNA2_188077_c0_seq1:66-935(+)